MEGRDNRKKPMCKYVDRKQYEYQQKHLDRVLKRNTMKKQWYFVDGKA